MATITLAGTWVSTILVFYFTRESFQSANASVTAALKTVSEKLVGSNAESSSTTLNAAMTQADSLKVLTLSDVNTELKVTLYDVCQLF